jgi:outer membrane protein TolC
MRAAIVVTALAGVAAADPAPTITFREAIDRAVAQNPDARVALDEVVRAEALLRQARAALWPQLGAAGSYTRLEGDRTVAMRLANAANSELGSLTVTAPIVDLRARADKARAADAVDVAAKAATSVRRDVAIAAARAYFAALLAAKMVAVARLARDNAKAHVAFTESLRTGGLATELDLVRARSDLAADESDLASDETSRVRAEEALGVITGTAGPLSAGDEPVLDARAAGRLEQRADLVASRRREAAAAHSVHLGWTDYAPVLALTGDAFVTNPQIDPIPRDGYQVMLTLNVTLFDAGLRSGIQGVRRAALAEAREQLAGAERQARSDDRTAAAAIAHTRVTRDAAEEAAQLAARALELAKTSYQAGTATALDLLDAERTARDAGVRAAIADDELRQAALDVLAATGGFP